jgi:hypothetical protein
MAFHHGVPDMSEGISVSIPVTIACCGHVCPFLSAGSRGEVIHADPIVILWAGRQTQRKGKIEATLDTPPQRRQV